MASPQSVAAMACLKTFLMIFNFAFWVSGVVILTIGIWVQVKLNKLLDLSTEYSSAASYILIAIGIIIIACAFLACCCTVKGRPRLLYLYSFFLFVILLLEISAGFSIFIYRNRLRDGFDKGLNESLINYRNESWGHSSDLDLLQSTLQCCGKHDFTDWWNLNPPVPESCCIKANCNTSDPSNIYNEGCYDKVVNFIMSHVGIVAGSASGLALFPLVGIILSYCLASALRRANYQPME